MACFRRKKYKSVRTTRTMGVWQLCALLCLTVLDNAGVLCDLSFSVEPSDTVVLRDRAAVLDCAVQGTSSEQSQVHIEWKRDGQSLTFRTDSSRSILSNGSLYFSDMYHSRLGRTDEGRYQCVATVTGVGTILSRSARLLVSAPPHFEEEPRELSVMLSQTARFSCAAKGVPTPSIQWLRDNRPLLIDESRMLVLPSGSLEIDDVRLSDQGQYSCNASSMDKHWTSQRARLTVHADLGNQGVSAPSFIAKPKSTIAVAGTNVTLDCAANGNPRPWIAWLKDGATIDMADLDSRFMKIGTGSLQIIHVQESDQGVYQCRAENKEDSADAVAELEVQVPPRFVKRPQNVYAYEKKDIEFQCEIYGRPEPLVQWMKNGELIVDSNYFQTVNGNNLRILGLVQTDAGIYQCIGSNSAGNIQTSAQLQVLQPGTAPPVKEIPSAPRNLAAVIVSTRFATLSWREPANVNSPITAYSVYYRQDGSPRERVVNTTRARLEEANIQGLLPARKYKFRVVAYNQHGPGATSPDIEVETQPEVHVPSPPLNLNAVPMTSTSILVTWKPPEHPNGQIKRYKMFYMQGESAEEHEVTVTDTTSYLLTDLEEYTEYSIWVVAFNHNGQGASTDEVVVRTFSEVPSDVPQNVTVEAASSTSVIVRWEPPPKEHQNGVITGYKIRYKQKGRRKGETVTTDGNRRLYSLTQLDRGAEYQIRVSASTVNGSGPATDWMTVETYENDLDESQVPDPPNHLKARPKADSIVLTWSPPRNQNIMVRGYTIGWGKGIPDIYSKLVDGKQRSYVIDNLESESEYVISLRAFNEMGDGRPIYETVRTQEEPTPEPLIPLIPPVGLKAIVLSSSSVVLYWTDSTLSKSQVITDNRYYVVRYTSTLYANPRYKYLNVTSVLNCMVDDLKPNTQYEFTVKVVRGRRESPWSLVVMNSTYETAPLTAPRDLTVVPVEDTPTAINLNWQPPKQPNGQITGYVIFYTTNNTQKDRDWVVEGIVGDKMTTMIRGLTPSTTYYFKIQARNSKGYGPLSSMIVYTTGEGDGTFAESGQAMRDGRGISNTVLYIILGCALGITFVLVVGGIVLISRRRTENQERSKKGYLKGNAKGKPGRLDIKPPDLWIHHDQMELKAVEKSSQNSETVVSVSPVPRHSRDFDPDDKFHPGTSSLDKRTYMSSYIDGSSQSDEKPGTRKVLKPKPIMIPVDNQPLKEPVATATPVPNGSLNQHGEPRDPSGRPLYPRTQYNISRAHVTIDAPAQSPENPYGSHGMYDSVAPAPCGMGSTTVVGGQPPSYSAATGTCSAEPGNTGTVGKRPSGHPLKSFSVPAPPPQSAPTTPQPKHIVTARPQGSSSPYKKAGAVVGTPKGRPGAEGAKVVIAPARICETGLFESEKEEAGIQPSYSTEELNQEMANLEGLMKDLNAITASEFEC